MHFSVSNVISLKPLSMRVGFWSNGFSLRPGKPLLGRQERIETLLTVTNIYKAEQSEELEACSQPPFVFSKGISFRSAMSAPKKAFVATFDIVLDIENRSIIKRANIASRLKKPHSE